jgi:hypothetical protein
LFYNFVGGREQCWRDAGVERVGFIVIKLSRPTERGSSPEEKAPPKTSTGPVWEENGPSAATQKSYSSSIAPEHDMDHG